MRASFIAHFSLLTIVLLGGAAQAQTILAGHGVLEWQALTSNGWQSSHVVVESAHVQLRLVASWNVPVSRSYFAQTFMDVVVAGAGETDWASACNVIVPPTNTIARGVPSFVGPVLKIDALGDSSFPGEGNGWVYIFQDNFTGIGYDSPIPIYEFLLDLDGSLGTRSVTSVHRDLQFAEPRRHMRIADFNFPVSQLSFLVETEIRGIDIEVIPAPSSAILGVVALSALGVRRRQRSAYRDWPRSAIAN